MAKKKGGGSKKLTMSRKSSRGPAKEVRTGDGGIKNTVAGKRVKRQPGNVNSAARVPGATRG